MRRILSVMVFLITLLSLQGSIAESAGNTLQSMYQEAELLMVQGNYTEAATKFEAMGAYSDASKMSTYCKAIACAEMELYDIAIVALEGLGEFKDCPQLAKYYTARYYEDMVRGGCVLLAMGTGDADLRVYNELLKQTRDIYAELVLYKDSMTRYKDTETLYDELKAADAARIDAENTRINAEKEKIYQQALACKQNSQYLEAIEIYNQIPEYKDSKDQIEACSKAIYQQAEAFVKDGETEKAIETFLLIPNYADSAVRVRMIYYDRAVAYMEKGEYTLASQAFAAAGNYSDAADRVKEPYYRKAEKLLADGKYSEAIAEFEAISDYSDAVTRVLMIHYDLAEIALAAGEYDTASAEFTAAGEYSDAESRIQEPFYVQAEALLAQGMETDAIIAFRKAGDFSDASLRLKKLHYILAEKYLSNNDYQQAAAEFDAAGDYSDASARVMEPYYIKGTRALEAGKYEEAYAAFAKAKGYSDAETQLKEVRYQQALSHMAMEEYKQAYEVLLLVKDYRDVNDILRSNPGIKAVIKAIEKKHAAFSVGKTVKFGLYEQNNKTSDGKEAIEWFVIEKDGDKVKLLSKYILDKVKESEKETWLANLRNTAFDADEKTAIETVRYLEGGSYLSKLNLESKFSKGTPTRYATERGMGVNKVLGGAAWWLSGKDYTAPTRGGYEIFDTYTNKGDHSSGARPVIWLDISLIP